MANFDNLTKPPFLIKVIELILGAICVGLIASHVVEIYLTSTKIEVIYATYFGFFMVSAITVLSYILDAPIKGVLMMVISFCAGVMYFTAGALVIEAYDKGKHGRSGEQLGAGITGILTGIIYLVDLFLSWRNK